MTLLTRPLVRRATFIAVVALLGVYVGTVVLGHGAGRFSLTLYLVLLAVAALIVGARAVAMPVDRLAWSLIAVGLAMSAAADILWTSYFVGLDAPPYPSL